MKLPITLFAFLFALNTHAALKDFSTQTAPFKLPPLPYKENSLSKAIDTETMKIHHGKHHQAYIDKLNKALENDKADLITILTSASKRSTEVRDNAGGHWNHSFFWTVLSPKSSDNKIPEELKRELTETFGSIDKFKEEFEKAGAALFGSGWAWLIRNSQGKLEITTTPNQDNPLMDVAKVKGTPILGADVWEHAYYLKYQNKRADYLKNFWKVVNWKQVQEYNVESKPANPQL